MPTTTNQTLSRRRASDIDFVVDRNFLENLDPDHGYTLTRTTTETIKLSKSASKSKKTSKVSTYAPSTKKSRRGSDSSCEEGSKPKPKHAPRDISELFARLISQIEDRLWVVSTITKDGPEWQKLLSDVKYIRDTFDEEGLLDSRKAMELQTTLLEILEEAEAGRDVKHHFQSLRKGAKKYDTISELRAIRKSYLKEWGTEVGIEKRYIEQRNEILEKEKAKQKLERVMSFVQRKRIEEEQKKAKEEKEKPVGFLGWLSC